MAESKSAKKGGGGKGKSEGKSGSGSGSFLSHLVEPVLLFHFMTAIMTFMVVQGFVAEKVCLVNLGYSPEVCDALNSQDKSSNGVNKYEEEEKEVQKMVGDVMMWKTVIENVFPIVLVILIGSWSDKYGRKVPMLFVVLGFMVQNLGLMLCVYLGSTVGAYTVALVCSVIPGLTGNQACFSMAAFNYVTDTTPKEKLSVRTGISHSSLFFGITVGLGLGGFLSTTTLGFTKIFAIGFLLELAIFLYILVVIRNVVRDPDAIKGKSLGEMAGDLLSLHHLKDAFSAVLKKRPGNTRMKLILLLLSHFCIMAPMMGEMGVMYLFGRMKFGWDGGEFGAFMTYKTVLGFLGNFISMGLLTQTLKFSDPAVGVCACVSLILASILSAFANTNFVMYCAPVVAIISGANMIVPRATLSKFIPTNEQGKVMSFLACLESISPLVAAPLYTMVYTSTFEVMPGAIFLLTAALTLVPILIFSWFLTLESEETKTK